MKSLFIAVGLALTVVGTGGAGPVRAGSTHPVGRIARVRIVDVHGRDAFEPHQIKVRAGTTVVWTNYSSAQHTVTDQNGKWSSANFGRHQSYSRRFTRPGRYDYICGLHGYMTGVVVVTK